MESSVLPQWMFSLYLSLDESVAVCAKVLTWIEEVDIRPYRKFQLIRWGGCCLRERLVDYRSSSWLSIHKCPAEGRIRTKFAHVVWRCRVGKFVSLYQSSMWGVCLTQGWIAPQSQGCPLVRIRTPYWWCRFWQKTSHFTEISTPLWVQECPE